MNHASLCRPSLTLAMLICLLPALGCKSGGSSWARWNPWSKASDDATLVAESAPALPSANATPLIETGSKAQAVASIAEQAAPAFQSADPGVAVAVATPQSEAAKTTANPSIPSAYPTTSPRVAPANPAAAPPVAAIAAHPSTPSPSTSSAGPYDPNGYKPAEDEAPIVQKSVDRYATVGNRYEQSASDQAENLFENLPDFGEAAPAPAMAGDRYASSAVSPATTAQQAYPSTPIASMDTAQSIPTSTTAVATASASPVQQPAQTAPASQAIAAATPVESPRIGTISASNSIYTPKAPVVAAPTQPTPSEIRLTSLPGEYRPGGTGTYRPQVSVATRPEGQQSTTPVVPASGAAAYPATSTPTQLR